MIHLLVSVSKSSELLLSSSVPHIEDDLSKVGGELKRVHLDSESSWKMQQEGMRIRTIVYKRVRSVYTISIDSNTGPHSLSHSLTNIFLLELSGHVSLHEGGLSHTSISHQNQLELRNSSHCILLQIVSE